MTAGHVCWSRAVATRPSRSGLCGPALDRDAAGPAGLLIAASVTDASATGLIWEYAIFDLENPG